MAGTARFYLARVIKLGSRLDQDALIVALRDPVSVHHGDFYYTFTDIDQLIIDTRVCVVGRLAKFLPEGEAGVVDTERHAATSTPVTNFLRAAARFVYLPDIAVVAYEQVWNEIETSRFEKVFPLLVREKYRDFFVQCALEPIVDVRTFIVRIARLDRIVKINAVVNPPNPLFGVLWASLRDYIRRRRAGEVAVREQALPGESIKSDLPAIAQVTPEDLPISEEIIEKAIGKKELDITDAATLMAADGYGKAQVHGREKGKNVVIRTRENQITFDSSGESSNEKLAEQTQRVADAANFRSGLRH
jgi:hypothetical protein